MLSRFIFLFISLAFILFACLPVEHSYVRGGYDSNNLLEKQSAYHTNPYQCLVEINGDIDPDGTDIIHVGNASGERLCLPSNELSYLVKAKKPTTTTTTKKALKIAVLFDSSYSLRKTDPGQLRFSALKTYLLALFDKVENGKITASKVEVSFFPFKYCSHAKFPTTLTITKGNDRVAFETKIDALIGSGNGNAGGDAANKIKKLKNGTLVPKTLKGYGAYGSTNYLQAFAKAKKHLSSDSEARKNIVIFSDGLPLTYNEDISTYNEEECTLPKQITEVSDYDWEIQTGAKGAKGCVLDNAYPGGEYDGDACTAPTSKDIGITGKKAYSDPMNHLMGMIQHSQQINKAINKAKGDDIHIYAVHLKVCNGLAAGERHLCQNISKPFFESFSDGYFPARDASSIAKSFDGVLEKQSNIDYEDRGKVTLASSDEACQVSSGANTIQGMSKKYDESENFSFLKTQRIIKVGEYKGKGKGKGKSFYDDLSQTADINLGLPHQKNGTSLTNIKHKAGALGEKEFNICIDFEYKDSCVSKSPKDLRGGMKYNLQVHEYKDSRGNNIYCVLPKPIPVVSETDVTVVDTSTEPPPEVVNTDNSGTTSVITVDDVNDDDNDSSITTGQPNENPPPNSGTNTGVVSVNSNPPTNPTTNNNPVPVVRPVSQPPTTPTTSESGTNTNQSVGQNSSGAIGRTRPVSVLKVERIGNWHIEY